ncbi:MAG TPA: hypothetical protein VFV49_13255, partial [Thermoanaerobaculia bacterium]|nr:hypothetical protein [Thermoanaerobaculia bacterium]
MKSWYMRVLLLALVGALALGTFAVVAQEAHPSSDPAIAADSSKVAGHPTEHRSEADLILPDLGSVQFLNMGGDRLLIGGLIVCVLGLFFGLAMYVQLKNLPVHRAMREISELIYETCKTYLITQGKFILLLELFIGAIMVVYFGVLRG